MWLTLLMLLMLWFINVINVMVLGLSLITNEVILDYDTDKEPPCHQEVMETAEKRGKDLQRLVKELVGKINF